MSQTLQKRSAIAPELTWDLTHLFPDEAAYKEAVATIKEEAAALVKSYRGRIKTATDPAWLLETVQGFEKFQIKLERAGYYAMLSVSVDMTDAGLQSQSLAFEALAAELASKLAFFENELLMLDDQLLAKTGRLQEGYNVFFTDLIRQKRHQLAPETEEVLSALAPALSQPYTTYEQAKHADMPFPAFTVDGREYPLSFVLYENVYQADPDPAVRRTAFETFSAVLEKYQNTVASGYNGEIQKQKTLARLRGFDSVIDYLLHNQKVPRALFDRQIDLIMAELAPHMRRYARLLQKTHGLEEMTFADLKIALDPGYDPQMSIAGAKELVGTAFLPLGKDYQTEALQAFSERWIDFAQNIGKSTGGFCASPYETHSYILLSWTDRLSEVFTLAHELGHAMHFQLAHRELPYLASNTSLYFVEAPSTMNELLLTDALLAKEDDPRLQRWVLSSLIQNTYYHNFVTHLLEAAFQRLVYARVDAGEQLQAGDFNQIKRSVLEEFWGDAVRIEKGADLTWMRQPHYYMGLYPYTYSAGLTLSTVAHQAIRAQGQSAVDAWLQALRAGGTVDPVGFANLAGVDLDQEAPLRETITFIGSIIDQIH